MQNYKIKVQRLLVSVLTFDICTLSLRKRTAFTLIELLITIAIIAIVTGSGLLLVVKTNFQRGRDGRRQADLESIRSALEIYRSDNGTYIAGASLTSLAPNYIGTVPTDPLAGQIYGYLVAPAGCNGVAVKCTAYTLCAALERVTTLVGGCGSCGGGTCSYKTTNP